MLQSPCSHQALLWQTCICPGTKHALLLLPQDQDLPLDQAETSFPTSSDPLDVARRRLHSSDPHQQALAVDALWTATCEDIVDAAQRIYAAGLVPGLAQLLSSPTQGIPACAAATLGNILSASPPACTQAAAAGAVPTLIQLLDSKPDDVLLLRYAVGALESIADNAEQSTANMQPAVGPLVDLLSCDDISTQSRAVGCLWSVMRYDEAAKEQALAAGAAERLAELLQCAVAIHDAALLHRVLMTAGILSPHPAAKRWVFAVVSGGSSVNVGSSCTKRPELVLGVLDASVSCVTPSVQLPLQPVACATLLPAGGCWRAAAYHCWWTC
jgi:hypothetical protein